MKRNVPNEIEVQDRAVLPASETDSQTAPNEALGEPLDLRAVAELIGCSSWTVRQTLIPRGLPCFRSGRNGKLIFFKAQVIRWIVRNQRREGGQP